MENQVFSGGCDASSGTACLDERIKRALLICSLSAVGLSVFWCVASDDLQVSAPFFLLGGIALFVSIVAFFAVLILVRGRQALCARTWAFLAVTLGIAFVPALSSSLWVRAVNAPFVGLSCLLSYRFIVAGDAVGDFGVLEPFKALATFAREQFSHWKAARLLCRGNGSKTVGSVVLGLFVALVVLACSVPLLARADAAFSHVLSSLFEAFEFGSWQSVWRVLRFALVAMLAFSLLWAAVYPNPLTVAVPAEKGARAKASVVSVVTALVVIDAVYLLFICVDIAELFGKVPEATELSEYARSGFFELTAVGIINLVTLSFALLARPADAKSRPIDVLELVLVVVTAVMLVSAARRMLLYVSEFGLTLLRLLTLWAMVGTVALLVVAVIRIARPTFPAFRVGLFLALALWAGFGLSCPAMQVANYNADAYLSGRLEDVDVYYMEDELGNDALPAMRRLSEEAQDFDVRSEAEQYVRYVESTDYRDWHYVTIPELLW